MINLSIITVTMNHLVYVKSLLNSLYHTAKPTISFELIIVDNCSSDGTVEFIEKNYPNVNLIVNSHIYGFSKNNNIGFENSVGGVIAIINPDIIILPNSIDLIYHYLLNGKNVGMCCPKLLNPDLTRQLSIRKFITPYTLFNRFITAGKDESTNAKVNEYLMKDADYKSPQKIDWALGAVFFIKRETYQMFGGFDENFFLYVEDVDLCLRMKKAGLDVIYVPDSNFIHVHKRSSRKINKSTFYHFRSMFYYFWKHNLWLKKDI